MGEAFFRFLMATRLGTDTIDPDEAEAVARILTRKQVLNQNVEWGKLSAAGIINQEEVRLMSLYDKKSVERKISEFREVTHLLLQHTEHKSPKRFLFAFLESYSLCFIIHEYYRWK